MAEAEGEVEIEAEAGAEDQGQKLLFNRWDMSEVEIKDPSLARYVNLHAMIVPHSCGKLVGQQFNKSNMLIVERLINKLMQTEKNSGKKELGIRIVRDAFEIIHTKTKKNPVQVLVDAVENTGPREETVRLKYGGINVPRSVDTAPQRRVDIALRYISDAVYQASHKKKKTVSEALAEELMAAANGDTRSSAVSKKEERERIAKAAR